jgi:hypothetical protein
MINNDNNKNNDKKKYHTGNFVNGIQRKFFLITKAFKIGNIVVAGLMVVYIGKSLFGV